MYPFFFYIEWWVCFLLGTATLLAMLLARGALCSFQGLFVSLPLIQLPFDRVPTLFGSAVSSCLRRGRNRGQALTYQAVSLQLVLLHHAEAVPRTPPLPKPGVLLCLCPSYLHPQLWLLCSVVSQSFGFPLDFLTTEGSALVFHHSYAIIFVCLLSLSYGFGVERENWSMCSVCHLGNPKDNEKLLLFDINWF